MSSWEKVAKEIPVYFHDACDKYSLTFQNICNYKSALIGEDYAIVFADDRFSVEVFYFYVDGNEVKKYMCGSFFSLMYDRYEEWDKVVEGVEASLRKSLIIHAKGMTEKWDCVLSGEKEWIIEALKSPWFAETRVVNDEEFLVECLLKR